MTTPIVLARTITNTLGETRNDAQYIGDLNSYGSFDIALTGHLAARDKGDYYSFRVTTSNVYVRLAAVEQASGSSSTGNPSSLTNLVNSGDLRYQLYTQTGKLIADSDPGAGDLYTAYQALTSATNMALTRGNYTVKVSPGQNAASNTAYDYILSLQSASTPIPDNAPSASTEEFQTTANAATQQTNPLATQTNGWLPTVLAPTSSTNSLFSALGNYVNVPRVGGVFDATA